jgi:hypothetical protein
MDYCNASVANKRIRTAACIHTVVFRPLYMVEYIQPNTMKRPCAGSFSTVVV